MAGQDSSPVPFRISRLVFRALFGTGVPRYLVVLIVILTVLVGLFYGISLLTRPWAHGDPALVGY